MKSCSNCAHWNKRTAAEGDCMFAGNAFDFVPYTQMPHAWAARGLTIEQFNKNEFPGMARVPLSAYDHECNFHSPKVTS